MTCGYCGLRNSDTEHRCRRCGRRPGDTLSAQATVYRTTGALATKPRPVAMERPTVTRTTSQTNLMGAVQGSLFTPNVIPISARMAPLPKASAQPPVTSAGSPTAVGELATASTSGVRQPARRKPRVSENQGELELAPVPAKARLLSTTVDARIYCDATAAGPIHRVIAAALDWIMILIGYGIFLATFAICGGSFDLNRTNLMVFGGALLLIACTYGLFWSVAGTETAGMRWTHLKLITFDGFKPEPRHRAMRFLGTCLSLCTIVGALWAFADEEGLGWQDHMSGTFPTAQDLEARVLHRR